MRDDEEKLLELIHNSKDKEKALNLVLITALELLEQTQKSSKPPPDVLPEKD